MVGKLICTILDGMKIVTLPVDLIAVLAKVTVYGNYIVGSDLMLIIASSIMFWITARVAVGLPVFLWKLLPFT
jgi:hypothetical protein